MRHHTLQGDHRWSDTRVGPSALRSLVVGRVDGWAHRNSKGSTAGRQSPEPRERMGGAGSGLAKRYAKSSHRRSNRLRSRYGVDLLTLRSQQGWWGGSGPAMWRYYGVPGGWDGRSLFLVDDAAPVWRNKGPSPSGVVGRVRARGPTQSFYSFLGKANVKKC